MTDDKQRILVFQQNGSGEQKIEGIRDYGKELFSIESISIDTALPPVIDDPETYLPEDFSADLVLDFLKHPDLSHELVMMCKRKGIPVIASRKKIDDDWVLTPPT
jgi:hypothetical protein